MTTDQVLQDEIIHLQKRDLALETRHLVEEATQLLAEGREMEARALVEKAQAITGNCAQNGTVLAAVCNGAAAAAPVESRISSRISSRLALDVSASLTQAIEDLQHYFQGQMSEAVASLEGRLNQAGEELCALKQKLERAEQEQAARSTASREQWDRLSASITSLEETDRAHWDESQQLSRNVSGALETISSRVIAHEERFDALDRVLQDLSPKVHSAIEQIDRHTEMFRSMHERQAHRAAALNEVLDSIARLRETRPLIEKAAAQ